MGNSIVSEDNKFQFKCPVFEAPTKVAACVKLRDMVWKGERPEKRQGCQVAMRCGTCPIAHLVQYKAFSKSDGSNYYAEQPVMGRLDKDILTRIQPVLNTASVMSYFSLSPGEIKMLNTSGQRIAAMIGKAPAAKAETKVKRSVKKTAKVEEKPVVQSKAAATGDLSAAIND